MSKKKRVSFAQKSAVSGRGQQSPPIRRRVRSVEILGLLVAFGLIGLTTVLKASKSVNPLSLGTANPPTEEDFPSQGQTHIADGQSHPAYNSNPPTSGWHYATPADWGIYQQTIPDEVLIHNLEHGGIWISYRNADDQRTIQQLTDIVRRYPDHVILTPRPANDRPIAIAAWGHLLKLDTVDSTVILDFIARYIRKGPENV